MSDRNDTFRSSDEMTDVAIRSQEAGIADGSDAYKTASKAPASIDKGDPATKNDGSGTSETD